MTHDRPACALRGVAQRRAHRSALGHRALARLPSFEVSCHGGDTTRARAHRDSHPLTEVLVGRSDPNGVDVMRRLGYFFVFALLVTTMSAGRADAGVEWCSEDPTFIVNGNIIDLNTKFLAQYKSQVKPPVVVELLVPSNAIAAVLTLPGSVPVVGKVTKSLPRWWGLLNMPVVARVTVKASASFTTYTRVIGTGVWLTTTVSGKSNQTTSNKFYLLLP